MTCACHVARGPRVLFLSSTCNHAFSRPLRTFDSHETGRRLISCRSRRVELPAEGGGAGFEGGEAALALRLRGVLLAAPRSRISRSTVRRVNW